MIIDSKQYNGLCQCGRTHKMETELCIVESGCMKQVDTYLKNFDLQGFSVAVYDRRGFRHCPRHHPLLCVYQKDPLCVLPYSGQRGWFLLVRGGDDLERL